MLLKVSFGTAIIITYTMCETLIKKRRSARQLKICATKEC
jgi:hypothetical protein